MPDPSLASAIILAGGASRRMGTDKASLSLAGETLLTRVTTAVGEVSDDILVVGGPARALSGNARYVPDDLPGAGPLGGIVTGLRRVRHPYAIVAACDMPFVHPDLIRLLLERVPGYDAAIPRFDGRGHPTLGVYSRETIGIIERQLAHGEKALMRLLAAVRVRWVDEGDILAIDPTGQSLRNVNTPSEWEDAQREILSRHSDCPDVDTCI